MSFHLTFFSILGIDFCHQNFGPLENKKELLIKILVIHSLHILHCQVARQTPSCQDGEAD